MSIWRLADYRWWLVGDTGGAAARAIRQFAVPLLAFGLSGSTLLAGVLGTVQVAIAVLATLPGGVIVDRHDRRSTIRVYALGGLIVWGAVAALAASGTLTFGVFFALTAVGALLGGLFGYATDAALRSIVGVADYPAAMATNQGRDAAVSLGAGPLGAFLYALSPAWPFAVATAGHVAMAASTWRIRTDLRPPVRERRHAVAELAEAWAWVWARPRLRWLVAVVAVLNLGFAGFAMGAQFSLLARGFGAVELGTLAMVQAVATLIGAVVAGRLVRRVPTGPLAIGGMAWGAVSLVPAALTDSYPVLLTCWAASSLLAPAVNAALLGYLFAFTPTELQGRVEAALTLATQGLAALGPLVAGALLPLVGHTLTLGLFVCLLVGAALVGAGVRDLRAIPVPDRWQEVPL